ncbi:MAG: sterol carrier protein domain-containing protein, partial [Candidatus Hodarchaeales archaeon]
KLDYNPKDFALAITIHDELCDWNNKTLNLESKKGKVITIEDNTSQEVDLEIDITSLAQLFVGSRSIHDLIEFQKIKAKPEKLGLINELFPKQINFFRDFF